MSKRSAVFMSAVNNMQDMGLSFIEAVKHVQGDYAAIRARDDERRDARESAKNLVDTWNAACPAGTRVGMRIVRGGPEYETTTRSKAWLAASCHASVLLVGRTGGWDLTFARALADGETLPALPPKGDPR